MLDDDLGKLLEIKKLYFKHANIHQNHNLLRKESQVRDFLERNEKKLLYLSMGSKKHADDQLMELGITVPKPLKRNFTKFSTIASVINK